MGFMKDLSIKKKLTIGFSIIILLSLLIGAYSVMTIRSVSRQTENMYYGPYDGVKSMLTVKSQIFQIHSLLQNISMSNDEQEILDLADEMRSIENDVFSEFKQIEQSGIIEEEQFSAFKTQFINWNPIRDEITNLCLAGMNDIAGRITNEVGVNHVKELTDTIEKLTENSQSSAEEFLNSTRESSSQSLVINILLLIIMLFSSAMVAAQVTKGIVPPIKNIQNATLKMAQGQLDIILSVRQKDEIGVLADALSKTIATLNGYIGEISNTLTQMAKGNMTISVEGEYKGDFSPIQSSLNEISSSLNEMLHQISSASNAVALSAQAVSSESLRLSKMVKNQFDSMLHLNENVVKISLDAKENAKNADQAKLLFEQIMKNASGGTENMNHMLYSMTQINQSSQKIQNVVKTIEDIAFQTNILSLNASIEAARAGEYGYGFGVVANEVRVLSEQSAKAAEEARVFLKDSLEKVKQGQCSADEAAHGLTGIIQGIEDAVLLIERIHKGSESQTSATELVVQISTEVKGVVTETSEIAHHSVDECMKLSEQSIILKNMIEKFHLKESN